MSCSAKTVPVEPGPETTKSPRRGRSNSVSPGNSNEGFISAFETIRAAPSSKEAISTTAELEAWERMRSVVAETAGVPLAHKSNKIDELMSEMFLRTLRSDEYTPDFIKQAIKRGKWQVDRRASRDQARNVDVSVLEGLPATGSSSLEAAKSVVRGPSMKRKAARGSARKAEEETAAQREERLRIRDEKLRERYFPTHIRMKTKVRNGSAKPDTLKLTRAHALLVWEKIDSLMEIALESLKINQYIAVLEHIKPEKLVSVSEHDHETYKSRSESSRRLDRKEGMEKLMEKVTAQLRSEVAGGETPVLSSALKIVEHHAVTKLQAFLRSTSTAH